MKAKKSFALLMYSVSYIGISILVQTTVKWYQYFYAPPEVNQGGLKVLIPLGLIGFTMIIARIFDGVADPIVAYFSDNTRSKLGRRIPYILYGSLPLCLSFVLIWFPPVQGESILNFIYLTVMLSLFFIFFTIVVAPYLALIGEITANDKERINLTMMQGITQVIGVMVAEAGSGAIIKVSDFRIMGISLGIVSFATLVLTPIFIKEKPQECQVSQYIDHQPCPTLKQPAAGLMSSLSKTLANRNFIYYLVPYLAIWFGINTLTIAMPYISEILLGMSAESSGFLIAGAFVVAVLFSPFLPSITLKYGKKKVMIATSFVFGILLILLGLFGTILTGYAAIAVVLVAGIPLAAALVVPNAMVADIAELDGIETGVRREAMFFGTQGLINKIVIGLSSLVTPLLFKTFGYSSDNPLGLQLCGPIAGLIVMAGIIVLNKYSLQEDKLQAVRRN
ncbi:MAG: MFS transporter [Firmicutes bacterium]|nr:MFS transporter [Bacillota bacterium]